MIIISNKHASRGKSMWIDDPFKVLELGANENLSETKEEKEKKKKENPSRREKMLMMNDKRKRKKEKSNNNSWNPMLTGCCCLGLGASPDAICHEKKKTRNKIEKKQKNKKNILGKGARYISSTDGWM